MKIQHAHRAPGFDGPELPLVEFVDVADDVVCRLIHRPPEGLWNLLQVLGINMDAHLGG